MLLLHCRSQTIDGTGQVRVGTICVCATDFPARQALLVGRLLFQELIEYNGEVEWVEDGCCLYTSRTRSVV